MLVKAQHIEQVHRRKIDLMLVPVDRRLVASRAGPRQLRRHARAGIARDLRSPRPPDPATATRLIGGLPFGGSVVIMMTTDPPERWPSG